MLINEEGGMLRIKTLLHGRTGVAVVATLIGVFSLVQMVGKVSATSSNITGHITNTSGGSVNSAYVYATAPSSTTMVYGPVTTNSSGNYTLQITKAGTYDIHIDPPNNTGYAPLVNSGVTVSGDQTINGQFTYQTNTLSGVLSDNSSNPIPNATIKLYKNGSPTTYQTTTNSTGGYSISAPAGYYYLYLSGTGSGVGFTLVQSNTSSINLVNGNLTLNLVIPVVTMTITALNNSGQQLRDNGTVIARATSGTTSLYPGDPGTTIGTVSSLQFSRANGATGTIETIAGASYAALGLESSTYVGSICESIPGTPSSWDCLQLPKTVTSDISINLPQDSPSTRNFSGVLTDSTGTPIVNGRITLIKYGDSSATATTDSNGAFSINAMPKKYYMKVSASNLDNMSGFTLTQSSSNPTIDLTTTDKVQNLQVNNTDLSVSAYDNSGNPNNYNQVNARATNGTAYLYAGDPGESIDVTSSSFNGSTGTMGTIIGAVYNAYGLDSSQWVGSMCVYNSATLKHNCLTAPLTVTGPTNVAVPQAP